MEATGSMAGCALLSLFCNTRQQTAQKCLLGKEHKVPDLVGRNWYWTRIQPPYAVAILRDRTRPLGQIAGRNKRSALRRPAPRQQVAYRKAQSKWRNKANCPVRADRGKRWVSPRV